MPSQASRVVFALSVAATGGPPVLAQSPEPTLSQLYHTAWTIRDGAPADANTLAQTADGFLWLGAPSGLFRFDGVRFELFDPP
jgi:ligand-binding sensor domain-containing protein